MLSGLDLKVHMIQCVMVSGIIMTCSCEVHLHGGEGWTIRHTCRNQENFTSQEAEFPKFSCHHNVLDVNLEFSINRCSQYECTIPSERIGTNSCVFVIH